MSASAVTLVLVLAPVLGSSAPGMCPSNLFWWFGNTSCATLPRRDWPYRVISYDPFESNLFTIFDYGSVPLECLQVDFRCLLNETLKEQDYQLGTLWFRCMDNPKFKQRFLVSENPIHSTVTYVPIPTCAPPLTLFNIAYMKIIAGRHLLMSTCRNDENELGNTQVHHKGHLLLSSGPPEDDWGILSLARRMFNQNFAYWKPREASLRICNCEDYQEFLRNYLDCGVEQQRIQKRKMSRSLEMQSSSNVIFPSVGLYLIVFAVYFV